MSSRRAVLAGSFASVALSPVAGRAQPATGGPTIGFLVPASGPYIGTPTAVFDSFRRGLADLGYVEGRNIRYEYRSAPDRAGLGEMAAELVRLKIDVLVVAGVAAFIAKPVSVSTPVVFGFSGDPVQAGLVGGLARPGGNMTGVTFLATELVGKRLALLKEAAPAISRVAVIGASGHPGERSEWRAWEDTGRALGVSLQLFELKSPADLDAALTAVANGNMDASGRLCDRNQTAQFIGFKNELEADPPPSNQPASRCGLSVTSSTRIATPVAFAPKCPVIHPANMERSIVRRFVDKPA